MTATKEQKEAMVKALLNLKAAVKEVSNLWESSEYFPDEPEIGITPFDSILEKNYPFEKSFFDVECEVGNWVTESVKTINSTIVDNGMIDKLKEIVEYNEAILDKVDGDQSQAEGLFTVFDENDGVGVWNPFRDTTLRYTVDPTIEYGVDKIEAMIEEYEIFKKRGWRVVK